MTTLLLTAAGLLPSFVWLLFYLRQDPHPEPRISLSAAFLIGIALTLPARIAEEQALELVAWLVDNLKYTIFLTLTLFGATIEELIKGAAAFLFCWKNRRVEEPVDAMVYSVVLALGFAGGENISAVLLPAFTTGQANVTTFLMLRFVSGTLLHALAGGLFGFGLAHWMFGHQRRAAWLMGGMGIAIGLHTLWNAAILSGRIPLAVLLIPMLLVGFVVLWNFATLRLASMPRASSKQ